MGKKIRIVLIILAIIILGWVLYPKYTGFIEKQTITGEDITLGEYSECFGMTLSLESGNRTNFRCIGIPFGRITI
jgi:hypothetical protein